MNDRTFIQLEHDVTGGEKDERNYDCKTHSEITNEGFSSDVRQLITDDKWQLWTATYKYNEFFQKPHNQSIQNIQVH